MTNDQSFNIKQMQQQIDQAVFNIIRITVRELQRQDFFDIFDILDSFNSSDSSDSSASSELISSFSEFDRWNSSNLDFFDSHLDKSFTKDDVIIVNKDVYFRSVILFINRIRDLIITKNSIIIKININIAFRDTALAWYTTEL